MGEPSRLIEGGPPAGSGSGHWALDLLRASQPYQAPPGRKQRVRLSVGHVPHRAPMLLRPVVVGVVLVGLGAIASAALGPALPRWVVRTYDRVVDAVRPPKPTAVGEPRRVVAHPVRVASASDRFPEAPAIESAPAPAATPIAPEPAVPRARRAARAATGPDDTALLLEAMRALRRQGDPVRARVLLGRYLQQHPNGALAEEALAMSIEAAVAAHDADAPALAQRYLRAYPAGPFRSVALQAINR